MTFMAGRSVFHAGGWSQGSGQLWNRVGATVALEKETDGQALGAWVARTMAHTPWAGGSVGPNKKTLRRRICHLAGGRQGWRGWVGDCLDGRPGMGWVSLFLLFPSVLFGTDLGVSLHSAQWGGEVLNGGQAMASVGVHARQMVWLFPSTDESRRWQRPTLERACRRFSHFCVSKACCYPTPFTLTSLHRADKKARI